MRLRTKQDSLQIYFKENLEFPIFGTNNDDVWTGHLTNRVFSTSFLTLKIFTTQSVFCPYIRGTGTTVCKGGQGKMDCLSWSRAPLTLSRDVTVCVTHGRWSIIHRPKKHCEDRVQSRWNPRLARQNYAGRPGAMAVAGNSIVINPFIMVGEIGRHVSLE